MLGFILSKMNLLILVVAIFAIVSYFTLSFAQVTKEKEAQLVVERVRRLADSLVNSPSYCDSVSYPIPASLSVSGGEQFYVMKISAIEIQGGSAGEKAMRHLIFQAFPRNDREHAIAADSFITSAEIRMFSGVGGVWLPAEEYVFADPQSALPEDEIVFVKEVAGGKPTLYILPCNSGVCSSGKDRVGKDFVHKADASDAEGGFRC